MDTNIPSLVRKKRLHARLSRKVSSRMVQANSWTVLEELATSKPRPRDSRWLPCFSVERTIRYVFVSVTRLAGAMVQCARTRVPILSLPNPPEVQKMMLVHASLAIILGKGIAIKKEDRPREAHPNANVVQYKEARARGRSQWVHILDSCIFSILSDQQVLSRDFLHSDRVTECLPAVRHYLFCSRTTHSLYQPYVSVVRTCCICFHLSVTSEMRS
jgi:hypothetical protein